MFFATLNTEMPKDGGSRVFIDDKKKNKNTGYTEEYMDHLVFRYKNLFSNANEGLKLFENIPFLNGGLFECLDRRDPETNIEMRIDGFSSTPSKQPVVPNVLFFGRNDDLDLSDEFENRTKYKHCKARGIINILNSYKFTIEENTPLEQEIALDPELLGKIFENLLASYNPETRTTARKQTGSYYTPREIVNYMVDESLIAYLKTKLTEKTKAFQQLGNKQTNTFGNEGKVGQLDMHIDLAAGKWDKKEEELESKLRQLFAYESEENPFDGDTETTNAIIAHLSECKILDPACGSGAFPMGILHKMVFALGKLDPCNYTWKQAQLEKAQRDKQRAQQFEDETLREAALKSAEDKIAYVEASFGETGHELDYARKLFLIENCIYGVDIQQIAVQISKLRFFISLMVDQRVDDTKPNRNILSLPNLETKFVAANTLIPVDKPQQLMFKDPDVEKTEKELHEIHQKIFFTRNYSDKKKLKNKELQTRHSLRKMYVEKAGYSKEAAEKITQWNPFDPLKAAPFFDPEVMFTIEKDKQGGYFDVVIGNPPYINISNLKPDEYRIELRNRFRSAKNKSDTYAFFIERAFDLLVLKGSLSYIIPQTWKATDSFSKLREILLKEKTIKKIVDLEFGTFDAIVKPMVLLASNIKMSNQSIEVLNENFENISKISIDNIIKDSTLAINTNLNNEQKLLFQKIEKDSISLSNIIQFSRGIKTSDDSRFIHKSKKNDDYRKVLRGKNIKAFQLNWNGEYIWYRPDLMKEKVGCVPYTKEFFEVPEKIVTQRVNSSMQLLCAYDNSNNYFLDTVNVSRYNSWDGSTSLKYLCGLLNSKLINFWYCNKYLMPTIGIYELHTIPIKKASKENLFIEKVEKIISFKKSKENSENVANCLDLMVYKLYTLTYDECKIVDPEIEKLISREDYERMSIEQLSEL